MGVDIMIGGLAFQVVSLFLFIMYATVYAWRWIAASRGQQASQSGLKWRIIVGCKLLPSNLLSKSPATNNGWSKQSTGLAIATITIFVRCVFRVAELREGFDSSLANDEVAFMILEGLMVLIASICLTAGHPGVCLDIDWKIPKNEEPQEYVDLANVHIAK
jgi:hypothetical protein